MFKKNFKFNNLVLLLIIFSFLSSCNDDDDGVILSNSAEITSFQINGMDATITGTDITISLPHGTDPTSLMAETTISEGATINPNPDILADYSTPKLLTVTAQDNSTTTTYTVTVTIDPILPTTENPFPEGVFIVRYVDNEKYEMDFRHTSGSISTKVFQNANSGQMIEGIEISDIIPHENGYLILGNLFDNSGGKIMYTNLKLEVVKEEQLEKCNVVRNNYARIDNKIYYTNISNLIEYNQPKNKTYVINTDNNTLEKFDNNQALQYFATSNGELFFTDVIRGLYKITDLASQTATDINVDFDDYTESFVMDKNNVLWSIYRTKTPQSFGEAQSLNLGRFDYKLKLIAYNTSTGTRIEGETVEEINRESNLFLANNNEVYLITNQNLHFQNPKKQLHRLHIDNNEVKLETVYDLPKTTSSHFLDMSYDRSMFSFGNNTLMVDGNANNTTYYYDIDLNNGTISNKTDNVGNLFPRDVIQ